MSDEQLLSKIFRNKKAEIKGLYEPVPKPSKPIITLQDVDNKFVERYFLQMVNDQNFIVEVDKVEFTAFKGNPRYLGVKIKWKIVGVKNTVIRPGNVKITGTEELNKNEVLKADLTMNGLKYYLKDYDEYWYAEQYE